MKFLLGSKLNMTQIFDESGNVIPVTVIKAGPVKVVQVKKADGKDKYNAVQVGFGYRKSLKRPIKGHIKDLGNFRYLREFRLDNGEIEAGQEFTVAQFNVGDMVDVQGTVKGRGFAGAMKRHGFHGAPASHGHDHPRAVGSIGSGFPQHTLKGRRMAGRMGGGLTTVKNLEVIAVDPEKNLLAVKGAIPGARGGLLKISESKNKSIKRAES